MRRLLIISVGVLLTALVSAQSRPDALFETTNPVTLSGTVLSVGSYTGTRGPEAFLIFEVPNGPNRRDRWAARVASPAPVTRGEPVLVTGFTAVKTAKLADLLPYGAVPMLAPIAGAGHVIRATEIKRPDGRTLTPPVR